jgi:programmed cell death 6-interacting protein
MRMLDDEERGDTELRSQFKERWTRTTSSSLTLPLREEAKKYMDIIQNAINADKVVQEKFRMNRDCIVLLSKQTVINSLSPIPAIIYKSTTLPL